MADRLSFEFPYRPRRTVAVILFVLAAAGLPLFAWIAANAMPVDFHGVELTADQVRWFAIIMAAVTPLAIVGVGLFLFASFYSNTYVGFTADSVTLPKSNWLGMPSHTVTLPLEQVVSAEVRPFVGNDSMLVVVYKSGRAYLFSNMFLKHDDFHQAARVLSEMLAARDAPQFLSRSYNCSSRGPGHRVVHE